ncbi:suppressor of fused, putative [Schistosoma mansoni]|uniref:suppressor of fused, putative n=1 Tax=Schistosoma mansoni TaxID=6183 RepID=UPI0001A6393A|nr:suppressor of fused, putative [Schistosoma mansoni]|eukprot:XP_018645652.1 suppressor of fused, putative [Schistosoma mansoni]
MSNSAFGPVLSSGTAPNLGSVPPAKEEHALGLKAIYAACRLLYPDQPTPLQVTAVRKFWMGGPDPLDFINMYANPGSAELQSPPHWHYVTNGLSDLYGDSRLHGHCHSTDGPSGFGFELTFRVKREAGEANPPTWPAHLLQSLARYVFYSQAQLMAGDHIPWPTSLDKQPNFSSQQSEKRRRHHQHHQQQQQQTDKEINVKELENARKSIAMAAAATAASILAANSAKTGIGSSSAALSALTNPSTYASMVAAALAAVNNNNSLTINDSNDSVGQNETKDKVTTNSTNSSRIHHMLLVEDPQLTKITTPYGYVQFLQLVGLCDEELRLVQRWTGSHVAELMSCSLETGGGLLVTDMRRNLNIFEMQPNLVDYINDKLKREGSNLSGVTTSYFAWAPITIVTLGELLPGEVESRRLRRQTQKRDSSSTSCLYSSKSEVQSGSKAVLFHNPSTDYNTHKSDTDIGSKTVAMDTDDTLVSFAVKKRIEDDEFIDVVGGGGNGGGDETLQKLTAESYINSSTSALASVCAEPNSLKISRFEQKPRASLSNRLSSGHLTSDCFPHSLGNRNVIDGQTISAPGGFSAWCSRVGPINPFNQSPIGRQSINKVGTNTSSTVGGIFKSALVNSPTELTNVVGGALGFRTFNSELPIPNMMADKFIDTSIEPKGGNLTPGGGSSSTTGDGSAPCTPLAHLSLSPASLDMMPTRIIDYLDVHLCREAGEMLPLAVNDRLRHGRHFTFLNANYPDHAITLVPSGVSGAFVSEETPYVARGPWLQILLTDDFLEQLEFQFSCLLYPNELHLPLVFRWPERHLRICLVDVSSSSPPPSSNGGLPSIPLPHSQTASVPNPVSLMNDSNNNIGNNSVDNSNTSDTSNISKLTGTPTTSGIHCNWNTSVVDNRLISSNNSGSVESTPQSSIIPSAFAKSDLLPSFLSLFPPGCIPPPNVLSSLFSAMATNNSSSISDNINTTNNDQSQTELLRKSFPPINQTVTSVPIFQTSSSPTSLIQPSASTLPNLSHIHQHQITQQQQVRQEHQPSTTSLPTEIKVDNLIDPNVFANNWSMFLQTLMRNNNNMDSLRQIISGKRRTINFYEIQPTND